MSQTFWNIAVEAPIDDVLTYSFNPQNHQGALLTRGQRVEVSLGRRKVNGVCLGISPETPQFETKEANIIHPDLPVLADAYMKWAEWLSSYYIYPLGLVLSSSFPPLDKKIGRATKKSPVVKSVDLLAPPMLTEEQAHCYQSISAHSGFAAHLVHGVTGSGKTEIYMRLIADVLAAGKTAILIVPEISLTPQLLNRFAARFGDHIAAMHSQLTDRERTNQWWDVIERRKKILIGARSALFCPVQDLGIIIVDEEHEPSYKQEEKLKYHARDAAIVLAKFSNCPVVLGSATPSLESYKNALEGKFHLHTLKSRVEDRALPDTHIVDLREQRQIRREKSSDLPSWLSDELYLAIRETLSRKEQAALFLNRRGFAQVVQCPGCGFVFECPNCDISLTLHGRKHLVCHYCDYSRGLPEICPNCKDGEPQPLGLGTEQVEEQMRSLFPEAQVARADRDEISSREQLEELIERMEKGDIDILVGTQMIAKGLDFPKLNLVGLVFADVGLNMPDFRASERSFQLITQVSGRAGRHIELGEKKAQVYIQTLSPENSSIQCAQRSNYFAFADQELQVRKELSYPPFGKLLSFRIIGLDHAKTLRAAEILARRCVALKETSSKYNRVQALGPAEAPFSKLRNKFRYQVLLKAEGSSILNYFCRQVLGDQKWAPAGVKIQVDVDPINLM